MRRLWHVLAVLFTVLLPVLLCGCSAGMSVEELFTLPQLPEEYRELSDMLTALAGNGYEYITPDNGPNLESVQMADLNGDGEKEVLVCLRRGSDAQPLKIVVFTRNGTRFEQLCSIEATGESIDNIRCCDLTGDGVQELVVGYRKSNGVREVSVYRIGRECLPLVSSEYSYYTVQEFDHSTPSLLVLYADKSEQSVLQCYGWDTDLIRLTGSCILRSTMADIARGSLVSGQITQNLPALLITGVTTEGTATTDVIIYRDGAMVNIAANDAPYPYCALAPQDINNDGLTELPRLSESAAAGYADGSDTFVEWYRCDEAMPDKVYETYHCHRYGWYLTIPQAYHGRMNAESWNSADGEYRILLSLDGQNVAALYTITGENRESRSLLGERFLITRLPSVIYAAELYENAAMFSVSEDTLREWFSLIVSKWDAA